jgi:phosphohistidine phosphatase SixA
MPRFILIRHAHAGERAAWKGDDRRRPLSDRGRAQAEGFAASVDELPIGPVLSSPATRCVQTVEPLARQAGRDVETRSELREGADPTKTIALMEAHARKGKKTLVLCAHGDVIHAVIELLHRRGATVTGEPGRAAATTRKGAWWVVDHDGETFTRAVWHGPTA